MEILKPWLSVKKKIDSHYTHYDNDTAHHLNLLDNLQINFD